jgi:hypothetical protein
MIESIVMLADQPGADPPQGDQAASEEGRDRGAQLVVGEPAGRQNLRKNGPDSSSTQWKQKWLTSPDERTSQAEEAPVTRLRRRRVLHTVAFSCGRPAYSTPCSWPNPARNF